jgi:Fe-S cluster assembly ATP-binding protein
MEIMKIKDLKVEINGKAILHGIDLLIQERSVHLLMGPNGGGKSSLANVIMGNPKYKITNGDITFQGQDLLALKVNERAKKGVMLAFQE